MGLKAEASLIEAISTENIKGIRTALIEYIRTNPSNVEESISALNYAQEFIDEIFEVHNDKEFKKTQDWNKDYFLNSLEELNLNFSEERFQHLCLVGAYIYSKDYSEDAIIINNTEPVKDMEIQVEKLKAGLALGLGLVAGLILGRNFKK